MCAAAGTPGRAARFHGERIATEIIQMDKQDRELLAKQMHMLDSRNDGVVVWTVLASLFVFLVAGMFVSTRSTDTFQVAVNDLPAIPLPGTPRPVPSMPQ
jgi:hypothetical protein